MNKHKYILSKMKDLNTDRVYRVFSLAYNGEHTDIVVSHKNCSDFQSIVLENNNTLTPMIAVDHRRKQALGLVMLGCEAING